MLAHAGKMELSSWGHFSMISVFKDAASNRCIASSNKCIATRNKKLLELSSVVFSVSERAAEHAWPSRTVAFRLGRFSDVRLSGCRSTSSTRPFPQLLLGSLYAESDTQEASAFRKTALVLLS